MGKTPIFFSLRLIRKCYKNKMRERIALKRIMMAAVIVSAASLAACDKAGDFAYWKEKSPIVPVPSPVYSDGDTYVFDEDGHSLTEAVVSASPEKVSWTDGEGAAWTSTSNPFLKPNDYSAHSGALKIERQFSKAAAEFFPLMVGKRIRFSVSERTAGIDDIAKNDIECEVVSEVDVYVRAGTFDTFETHCATKGSFETFYYSPKVHHTVLRISGGLFNKKIKELVSFKGDAASFPEPAPEEKTQETPDEPVAVNKAERQTAAAEKKTPLKEAKQAVPAEKIKASPAAMRNMPPPKAAPTVAVDKKELLRRVSLQAEKFKTETGTWGKEGSGQAMYGVQLGAFSSRNGAKSAWGEFVNRSPDQLGGFNPLYQEYFPKGGQTKFIRVIVGEFDRFKSAQLMCGSLKRHGFDCWSVELK